MQTEKKMSYLVKKCADFAIDGKISAKEWDLADDWAFSRIGQRDSKLGETLNETGTVKMLHSDRFWYVAVDMEDSDVVAQGTADQQHHYTMGDTIEIFLKPADDTYYWEMYGTPNGLRTTFFYPSRSYVFVPRSADQVPNFEVAASVDGVMNDWRTTDRGWKIEFKFPISEFEQYGAKFSPGRPWTFLIARQNYSRRLPLKELSTVPPIQIPDFHLIDQYGMLEIGGDPAAL